MPTACMGQSGGTVCSECKRLALHVSLFPACWPCSVDESGLMLHFFGPAGTKKLDLKAFNAFLDGLHSEMDRLEFQHYDPQGTVGCHAHRQQQRPPRD